MNLNETGRILAKDLRGTTLFFMEKGLLLIVLCSSFIGAAERAQTNSPVAIVPEKMIQQRLNKPILLDRQTILKTESTDASLNMNLGQNKSRLPGSGFQASQKFTPSLKAVYENSLLLPYWAETVSSDRYLHQNRLSMEWNLLSRTSLQSSLSTQTEYGVNQTQSLLSETKQKELGLKGKILKQSLWETGYRQIEFDQGHSIEETNLWYMSFQQPLNSSLGLLFQSEYRESGDPTQDLNQEDKRLNLGSGANYRINDRLSAQLRFDLKMQEELRNSARTWAPQEKRISLSVQGEF